MLPGRMFGTASQHIYVMKILNVTFLGMNFKCIDCKSAYSVQCAVLPNCAI